MSDSSEHNRQDEGLEAEVGELLAGAERRARADDDEHDAAPARADDPSSSDGADGSIDEEVERLIREADTSADATDEGLDEEVERLIREATGETAPSAPREPEPADEPAPTPQAQTAPPADEPPGTRTDEPPPAPAPPATTTSEPPPPAADGGNESEASIEQIDAQIASEAEQAMDFEGSFEPPETDDEQIDAIIEKGPRPEPSEGEASPGATPDQTAQAGREGEPPVVDVAEPDQPEGAATTEPTPAAPEPAAQDEATPAPPAEPQFAPEPQHKPSRVLDTLYALASALNRPARALSPRLRHTIGWVALNLLFIAACVWLIVLFRGAA